MWFNPLMEWVLKSPIHSLISHNTMILYYIGKKSKKAYHTPVSYLQIGDALLTISYKNRTWWKNFRDPATVKVLIAGHLHEASSQAFDEEATVVEGLKQYIANNPRAANMFNVKFSGNGVPDAESLHKAARDRIVVKTTMK